MRVKTQLAAGRDFGVRFTDKIDHLDGAGTLRLANDDGVAGENEELERAPRGVFQACCKRKGKALLKRQRVEHSLKEALDLAAGGNGYAAGASDCSGQVVEHLFPDFFDYAVR